MASITIPDETYRRLSRRASALKITVDELVQPALDQLANVENHADAPLQGDAWRAEAEALEQEAIDRSHRYPPGFVVDDRRETIYRERLDAQR